VLGDYAGANAFLMAGLGDRLGLFAVLAANEPQSSAELADRTGLQERYLREWLAGMAAAGYLSYDPPSRRYAMPDAHVPVPPSSTSPPITAKPSSSCWMRSAAEVGWLRRFMARKS
jgi:hypothetical protein